MKTYNKPEVLVVTIDVEDILALSVQEALNNWENAQTGDFIDLWK